MSGGNKFDQNKLRWDILPMDALEQVVTVLTSGARKYGEHNWRKGMEWNRLYGAMYRHLKESMTGDDLDSESGLNHLAHVACSALFLLEYQLHDLGEDNRYIYKEDEDEKTI